MTSIDSHVPSFLIYSFHRFLPYPFCGPGRISEGSVLIPAVWWSTVTYFCCLWGIHPSLLAWVCLHACGVQHGCTDPPTWSQWKKPWLSQSNPEKMGERMDTKSIQWFTPWSLFQAPKSCMSEHKILTFYGQLWDEVGLVLLHFCLTVL